MCLQLVSDALFNIPCLRMKNAKVADGWPVWFYFNDHHNVGAFKDNAPVKERVKALSHRKQPVKRAAPSTTPEESWRMSGKGAQDSAERKRCASDLQKLMALPNVSLSLFLTHEFREYTAVLNPQFALPTSRGGLCSLLDGPLQVIKEKIAREVEGSAGASVAVDIWSGMCIKDSFIAATKTFPDAVFFSLLIDRYTSSYLLKKLQVNR
ncbi:hypothetical protein Tcan_04945 [Toxocara canis]|uniref:Uncharacterized protein n=1 Tax=Toxocara canis TaxID=6265 RepID=A0A0B2VZT9_TOXCA|nr:hypothetical protein Tcan_04945 [Toxocara canis]